MLILLCSKESCRAMCLRFKVLRGNFTVDKIIMQIQYRVHHFFNAASPDYSFFMCT